MKEKLIDNYRAFLNERYIIQKKLKEIDESIQQIEVEFMNYLQSNNLESATINGCKLTIEHSIVPGVKDWGAFFEFVKSNDQFGLLRKQLNLTAYRESIDNGVVIPGVDMVTITKLKVK